MQNSIGEVKVEILFPFLFRHRLFLYREAEVVGDETER